MSFTRVLGPALLVAALAAGVSAQAKPAAKPKAGSTAAKPAAPASAISPALATLQFTAKELPAGVTPGEDVKCISVQALTFYGDPGFAVPIVPAPIGKVGQSFRKGKDTLGSVLAFEYEDIVSEDTQKFLGGLIWGEDGPTPMHPEQILYTGRFIVILSFPAGDPAGATFKSQLEPRLAKLAPHDWTKLQPLMDKVGEAFEQKDAAGGRKLLESYADKVADYAFAQYLLGEFASAQKDWPAAQAAYARAIELQDGGAEHMPNSPETLWAALDGLGTALLYQNLDPQAAPVLERAAAMARTLGPEPRLAHSLYNYACGLARLGRFDDCLAALTECIQLAPDYKQTAAKDPDLEKARKRADFKKLLGS